MFRMVKTKGIERTRRNWEGAIGSVPAKYSDGVKGATDIIAKAIDGEALYAAKIQEAVSKGSRAKGLAKVSDEDWRKAALDKGASRIATGMTAGKEKFASGMGQVLSVIESVSISPRTADPIANVDNRVKPIVAALHKMKE